MPVAAVHLEQDLMSLVKKPRVYKRGGFWYVQVWQTWPPYSIGPWQTIFTSTTLQTAYALASTLARTL